MNWLPKKTVIVPVDFSDESLAALETAQALVAGPGDLRVVHVLHELSPVEPGEMWDTVDNATRAEHAERALREALPEPLKDVSATIRFGDPGRRITEFAEEAHADLIVLPSTGRTGLARLLIGSVAERVVRLAHCPVLVLRR